MRGAWRIALVAAATMLLASALAACGSGDSTDSSSTSTAANTTPATAPNSSGEGNSAKGSDGFRTAGGDNSIQNYGDEADAAELNEASTTLSGYLDARANGHWGKQCELLAGSAVAPIEELASRTPRLKEKGCAAILAMLIGRLPASSRANPMTSGLASLRVESDRGFALFHGSHGVDYFVPMVKEDGQWKVGAIAPSEFP